MQDRKQYLDTAKGIAILFVTFFHTTRGFLSADILPESSILSYFDTTAYGFHVQIFFLLSGYFYSTQERTLSFLGKRVSELYHPYIVWSFISYVLISQNVESVNHPMDFADLLGIPVWPIQHYWFLLSLIVSLALIHVIGKHQRLLVAVALTSLGFAETFPSWIGLTAYFFPFAAAGSLVRRNHLDKYVRTSLSFGMLCMSLFMLGTYIVFHQNHEIRTASHFILSFLGCYSVIYLSKAINFYPICNALQMLGRNSLSIYLMHIIFGSGARIILYRLFPDFPAWTGVWICFSLSLLLPLTATAIAQKVRAASFLGLPLGRPQLRGKF